MDAATMPDPYISTHPDATPRLNAALAKAMGMVEGATKDSKNPGFMREVENGKKVASTYASLASVIGAIRDAFAACEIAYPQTTLCEEGTVTVFTHLRHSSGECMTSPFKVPVVQRTPQGFASATTYARRVGLMAAAGVAAEDDDGNEHSNDPKVKTAKAERVAPKPVEPKHEAKPPDHSKIIAAFAGLGVPLAHLEDRLETEVANWTPEHVANLRAFHAEKKRLAPETADQLAARLEAEKAEAGIAAEQAKKAATEKAAQGKALAQLDTPVKPEVVDANKAFAGYIDRIRAATTPGAVSLVVAEAAGARMTNGSLTALQRTANDRILVLNDIAAHPPKRRPQIEDKSTDVPF